MDGMTDVTQWLAEAEFYHVWHYGNHHSCFILEGQVRPHFRKKEIK